MKSIITQSFVRVSLLLLVAGSLLLSSCKKTFNIEPETVLTPDQMYRNVYDADAAVIGLYGKLMGLAKQYVILNELRADLMEVTPNADANLKEINEQSATISANNPYASPKLFYSLINDCNDVLKNFNSMIKQNKFTQDQYSQRYSDVGVLRSWLFFQLGLHYGTIPYVTDPLENIDAVKDPSKYPMIPFKQLIDSLITFTNTLPYVMPYPTGASINTGLITTVDGNNTKRFFIDKYAFLGDLNLWKGNYNQAASYYRPLMEHNGYDLDNPNSLYSNGDQFYQEFRQPYADVVANNDLCVGYIRYKETDTASLIENNSQGWRSMFARTQDKLWLQQWLWVLPFSSSFSPTNPFIDLFSNNGGSYLVMPSQNAVDNWNSQKQANGFPFDARGNFTWKTINGQRVIMKYLYNYVDGTTLLPINPLLKNGQWFLNRAANVHLHFAEAANRDNRHKLAYAFLNNGITTVFDTSTASGRDVTNLQNTLYDAYPYNFDARYGTYPYYRGDWYRHGGVRGCARLVNSTVTGDSTIAIENSILQEGALELAYEGERWGDLVRIATRRNDPSIVANAVYAKLSKDGNPNAAAVRTRLMNPANWYLPFKWN
ncbi:RagB/SusD family protein [Russula earlei]|uniref:RagB/SusD family protein n=1 Tax=Russula earlei TaxID=71964 RepID=A0ACC0U357_9AGAM|nr:RagB/SusD family protein [Russula earlei]